MRLCSDYIEIGGGYRKMLAQSRTILLSKHGEIDPHEPEGRGIPFHMIQELLSFCEYGSVYSICIKLLLFTGCRITELNNMKRNKICENYIFWECGKNQNAWRKEYLPSKFLEELHFYWENNRIPCNNVVGIDQHTFRRYYYKFILPNLSPEWRKKRKVIVKGKISESYYYQIKGFRKNFATLLFAYFWDKYDSSEVAVERVCKRMQHSSKHITVNHYIETMEQIRADLFKGLLPFEIIKETRQRRLIEYMN